MLEQGLFCDNCDNKIEVGEINVAADIFKCKDCGNVGKVSDLVKKKETRQLMVSPPEDSTIEYIRYSDSVMEINIPRQGVKDATQLSSMGFGCFWLGFVAFWTVTAASIGGAFALFSIPFWIVGIGMVYGFSKAAFEKQKIEVMGNTLTITKTRLLNSKQISLDLLDIDSIDMKGLPVGKQVTNMVFYDRQGRRIKKNVGVTVPTIKYGDKKETIMDFSSNEEKIWVAQLLKDIVYQQTQKEV